MKTPNFARKYPTQHENTRIFDRFFPPNNSNRKHVFSFSLASAPQPAKLPTSSHEVPMLRQLLSLTALTAALLLAPRPSRALDQNTAAGVASIGYHSQVTGLASHNTDDGLARPGFPARNGAGQIGITPGGVTGSTNRPSDDGFHAAGLGKIITAGIGRSTMETVPGRTPTYISIVVGTRVAPLVGGRGR
jgi:hypothetical protein